jgi:hypothetical protein
LHGVLLRIFATSDTSNLVPFSTLKAQALESGWCATFQARGCARFLSPRIKPCRWQLSVQKALASVDLDLSESSNLLEFEELALVAGRCRQRVP